MQIAFYVNCLLSLVARSTRYRIMSVDITWKTDASYNTLERIILYATYGFIEYTCIRQLIWIYNNVWHIPKVKVCHLVPIHIDTVGRGRTVSGGRGWRREENGSRGGSGGRERRERKKWRWWRKWREKEEEEVTRGGGGGRGGWRRKRKEEEEAMKEEEEEEEAYLKLATQGRQWAATGSSKLCIYSKEGSQTQALNQQH